MMPEYYQYISTRVIVEHTNIMNLLKVNEFTTMSLSITICKGENGREKEYEMKNSTSISRNQASGWSLYSFIILTPN